MSSRIALAERALPLLLMLVPVGCAGDRAMQRGSFADADSTTAIDHRAEIFRLPDIAKQSGPTIQLVSFQQQEAPIQSDSLQPKSGTLEPPIPEAEVFGDAEILGGADDFGPTPLPRPGDLGPAHGKVPNQLESPRRGATPAADTVYPIDLSNALGLGGASHSQIRLARERVYEAQADFLQAKTAWLPSLRFGVGWNKHDGRLQQTEGDILEISRNSLFVGGGAGLGDASLAGGASGPSRLVVNLSLADAIFAPRVATNQLAQTRAASGRAFNDALAEIGRAYFDLLEAHARLANAHVALEAADELLELTTAFAREGAGNRADQRRARAAYEAQRQKVDEAERRTNAASAELARLLRLDPLMKLAPVEEKIVTVQLVDPKIGLSDLVAQGLAMRPDLAEARLLIGAAGQRVDQERWRPLLPHVQVGASAGTFAGGPQTVYDNESGRSDVDLLAVWELQNAGYGYRAARQKTASQLRQARIEMQRIRDDIAAQIVTAANDVRAYAQQAKISMQSAKAAQDSYRLNFERVQQGEGLPLELLQSVTALHTALDQYTQSVASHNRSQIELLRALGGR